METTFLISMFGDTGFIIDFCHISTLLMRDAASDIGKLRLNQMSRQGCNDPNRHLLVTRLESSPFIKIWK